MRQSEAHLLSGTGLGNSHGDTEDGVGTKLGLVGGSIEVDQELVDAALVLDVDVLLDDGRGNDRVDVVNGLGDTLTGPLGLVTVTELASLVLTFIFPRVSLIILLILDMLVSIFESVSR